MYFRECPYCGAHLDSGEACDCKKETAQGAANTKGGKVEQISDEPSYSSFNHTER